MGYQGLFPREMMSKTGFSDSEFFGTSLFEFFGKVNFMKVGIVHADSVTTVMQTYAREIQESFDFSFGLDGVLWGRPQLVIGILNGIDFDAWNPETDPLIPAHFSARAFEGKRENKR